MSALPQDAFFQEVQIHFEERNGCLRVYTDAEFRSNPLLPSYLSYTLTQWFGERPHYHMRCMLPVVQGGDMVEIHAWFDCHVFTGPSSERAQMLPPT